MRLADSGRLVHQILADIVDEDPSAPLVDFITLEGDTASRLSRGDVWQRAQRFAWALAASGAARGDRVMTLLGNQPEFLTAFFGISAAGMVSVPLNTASRGDVLRAALEETEPTVVVTDEAYAPQIADVLDGTPSVTRFVVVGDASIISDPRSSSYEDFVRDAPLADPVEVATSDLATLLYTSGTTGRSKGVMCSHNMVVTWAEAARSCIGNHVEDVAFTCLPIYHGNGLCCTVLPTMLGRGRLAIAPRFSGTYFWRQVVNSQATTTNLLGAMGAILWRRDPSPLEREHRLRLIMIVPSPVDHYEEFEERFNLRLTELYGLTDNAIPLVIPHGERRPGSCGLPTEGWQCAVVNEYDEPVERGEVGELVLRPTKPYAGMSGYYRRPDATVEAWRNLWFHTGDYVRQDDEGWYYFVDRRKDSIRRGGENISSWEVEQAVLAHSAVLNAAAYGVDDEIMGHEVMASVIVQPGEKVEPQELVDQCAERLPRFAVPRYIAVLEAFPMTETEKVQKAALRDAGLVPGTWDSREQRYVDAGGSER
ncbi:MAG: AMP-binding protein [Propionibacteriales bacterium]|nr:AMP-binding protein [Propionibacteriales bacterium]